ncbi:MAG: MFS transporter [Peptococcaceae bacterium]|jgi:MFS family permease|nr:MFS transporter [Peptococcaceae bacterium]
MDDKRRKLVTTIGVVAVFSMGQSIGAMNGAIAKISETYALSSTTTLYISTIAALSCMISALLLGSVVGKKIGYRTASLLCALTLVVAGMLPAFLPDSLVLILILRVLFGMGVGGILTVENPLVAYLYPLEERAAILGAGTFAGFGAGMIMQLWGGVLAETHWNWVFLTHGVMAVALVVVFFCLPEPPRTLSVQPEPQAPADENKQEKFHLEPRAVLMALLAGVVTLISCPVLMGASFLSAVLSDSTTVAGLVSMCFSFGSLLGALMFSKLYKKTKTKSVSLFLLLGGLGLGASALSGNIPLLCVSVTLAGLGFSMVIPAAMMIVGMVSNAASVAFASSLIVAFMHTSIFLMSAYMELVALFTGDRLYSPIYIGVVIYLTLTLLTFIINPFPRVPSEGSEGKFSA